MPKENANGQAAPEMTEKAYNELVQVRRDKLKALQEAGNDTFQLTNYPQDSYSAQIKAKY